MIVNQPNRQIHSSLGNRQSDFKGGFNFNNKAFAHNFEGIAQADKNREMTFINSNKPPKIIRQKSLKSNNSGKNYNSALITK